MGLLSFLWRRGSEAQLAPPSDFFDVFHQKTLDAISDSRGVPLSKRMPAGGGGGDTAADASDAVREYYLHTAWLQSRYPLALLPIGQKRFVKWLFGKGRQQHRFTDEQILWFLHRTAEDLPLGIAQTYLLNPEWQARFPEGFDGGKEAPLLAWLRREFPKFDALRRVESLPQLPPIAAIESSRGAPGVNVLSHFCYPSGIQQAAVATKTALEAAEFRTSCRDVPAGVQTTLLPRGDWLGLEIFPVTVITVAPFPHFENCYSISGLARRDGVYRIAYWAWELDAIPEEWVRLAEAVDEIWAPTKFVADAMRTRMTRPVHEMLPGVVMSEIEEVPRSRFEIPPEHCVFLFMFDMLSEFERKNPLAVVRAFRAAFAPSEAATLVIKVSRGSADEDAMQRLRTAAADHNIIVIDESVSRAAAYGYLQMCDCFVSLHRSEGFGLAMAEAMLLGKPVIATNYSGNIDFMHEGTSLLVDYTMTEIASDGPIYKKGNRWAEPSLEHAASCMRRVFENREEAAQLGAAARAELSEKLALSAAGQRMRKRLSAIGLPVPLG